MKNSFSKFLSIVNCLEYFYQKQFKDFKIKKRKATTKKRFSYNSVFFLLFGANFPKFQHL